MPLMKVRNRTPRIVGAIRGIRILEMVVAVEAPAKVDASSRLASILRKAGVMSSTMKDVLVKVLAQMIPP